MNRDLPISLSLLEAAKAGHSKQSSESQEQMNSKADIFPQYLSHLDMVKFEEIYEVSDQEFICAWPDCGKKRISPTPVISLRSVPRNPEKCGLSPRLLDG
ncbi:hypothetical protein CLAFUW4_11281 [Fulvia fulva]|uniref:Uncharacterized protein n=1 Tax=Passalora fulva TaxID=5499 RepID=A0A9Q8PCV7_PASFU|nr:uncharacterized protein CLAFUR5_10322 [Fulvia fulva]KAK4619878.1 hypothetical protein CLAFUR4_11287 [Fulvia fulva]KAK4620960.1 hypothetical protein CLAFUR0_11292 [Fulvia fulva]UJO20101.1 hypothetical protein CLAFUR5_10322 [Fulvia fulva]WPV17506.1 hypothetical protein CLAFUW4_11281 [Fulvia fulva]WPV32424.1 hypothetical protein CLAFUW7_11277 [Fulvia fulva]